MNAKIEMLRRVLLIPIFMIIITMIINFSNRNKGVE